MRSGTVKSCHPNSDGWNNVKYGSIVDCSFQTGIFFTNCSCKGEQVSTPCSHGFTSSHKYCTHNKTSEHTL